MRHYRYPHRRPPWWPPDEPWPPAGPQALQAWRLMRGRFLLRLGLLLFLLFALASAIITAVFWWIASLVGAALPFSVYFPRPTLVIPVALIVAGLVLTVRALTRVAMPIGDLMQAAGRVAEGDYTARAAERGPRELRALAHAFNSMTARLQAEDEQRRNLLADVTHELRTPLTVIQGNLEGLLDGVYPRDDAHLAPILEETRVLSRLIDDLRTLALAESGALKLQKEPVDFATLVSETVAFFKPQAEAAGVRLEPEITGDVVVSLDPARIREVLENIIANALRYTARGGVVRVKCSVNGGTPPVATVAVSDSGAGIPADVLPHIFDRFYKSGDSRGSGLGLAIARNLVAAHGGQISAESQLGAGTTIRFTLPADS